MTLTPKLRQLLEEHGIDVSDETIARLTAQRDQGDSAAAELIALQHRLRHADDRDKVGVAAAITVLLMRVTTAQQARMLAASAADTAAAMYCEAATAKTRIAELEQQLADLTGSNR